MFKSNKKPADPVKRFRSAGFLVALAVLFFSVRVHADTWILDNIAQTYKTAATGWTGALLGYALTGAAVQEKLALNKRLPALLA